MFKRFLCRARTLAITAAVICAPFGVTAAPIEDFSLRGVDGQTVSSASLRGKVVVLAIGALWLPLSREQVQSVQKLADDYAGRAVEVIWVSTDATEADSKNFSSDEQLRAFAAKQGLRVRVLRDPEGQVARRLGADQVPAVIILDKQGNVAGKPLGGLDPKTDLAGKLGATLDPLL